MLDVGSFARISSASVVGGLRVYLHVRGRRGPLNLARLARVFRGKRGEVQREFSSDLHYDRGSRDCPGGPCVYIRAGEEEEGFEALQRRDASTEQNASQVCLEIQFRQGTVGKFRWREVPSPPTAGTETAGPRLSAQCFSGHPQWSTAAMACVVRPDRRPNPTKQQRGTCNLGQPPSSA